VTEGLLGKLCGGGVSGRLLYVKDLQDGTWPLIAQWRVWNRSVASGSDIDTHAGGDNAEQLLEVDRESHLSVLAATGNLLFQKVVIPVWSR
jgi:hypothetical protein